MTEIPRNIIQCQIRADTGASLIKVGYTVALLETDGICIHSQKQNKTKVTEVRNQELPEQIIFQLSCSTNEVFHYFCEVLITNFLRCLVLLSQAKKAFFL